MLQELMTKAEVAAWLRVTPRTVENYLKKGLLPQPRKVGGRPLWLREELQAQVRSTTTEPTA